MDKKKRFLLGTDQRRNFNEIRTTLRFVSKSAMMERLERRNENLRIRKGRLRFAGEERSIRE